MAIKNWKKMVALMAAVSVVGTGIPGVTHYASATDVDSTAESTDAEGTEEGAEGEEAQEQQQNVMEDGEVVQEGALGKVDKADWITIKDYELVAESDSYKMYLYEPRLSVMLEDKKTGKFIETTLSDEKDDGNSNATWNAFMKSGIVLTAIVGIQNAAQVDLISTPNTINVQKNDNGFSAEIFFTEYQLGLTVNVSLENDQLVVNVPDDSIVEKKEGTYIATVSLFPFMDYSFLDDEEGYMLIPDGNGALINLDNKEGRYTTGFSQMIYGKDAGFVESDTTQLLWEKIETIKDANEVLAPIFGVAHTTSQNGFLGIVEKGEKRASIEAHPNGVMVNYNRCYAKFLLRDIYTQPLNNSNSGTVKMAEADRTHSDLQVRYLLLSGEEANYSDMATKYRDYLIQNELITVKDNTYNTRVDFLGTDREEFLLGTRAVTMTTTENIEEMFGDLKKKGVESLVSVYKGWQNGGLYNVPITKYKADRHIGGTSKLTDLIQDSAKDQYQIYLYNDALRLNPKTNWFNFNAIKRINKRTYEEKLWAEVYKVFNFQTPEKSASNLKKLVASYVDDGASNLAVSGISNTTFSYSYNRKAYTRNDTSDAYSAALAEIDKDTNLILEEPAAYLWNNTDAFLDMPLGSSDYMYVDEEIPFLSMVLKGVIPMYSDYVNFEANKNEFFLQMVESGVYPSFYLTYENSSALIYTNSSDLYSTEFSTYEDTVAEYDQKLREVNAATCDAFITKHEKLENGVTKVTYNNGVNVYVNYTENTQTVDGVSVEGMSYSYKAGESE